MDEGAGSAGHLRSGTGPATPVGIRGLFPEPSPEAARAPGLPVPRSAGSAPVHGRRLRTVRGVP
uniref:hypothetical protein n=1 Tax=Streptomyces sp. NBRC 110465 TaxID=1897621 RepID=UPI001F1E27B8